MYQDLHSYIMLDDKFSFILACCINNTLLSMICHKAKNRATVKEIIDIMTYIKDSQHVPLNRLLTIIPQQF